MARSRRRPSCRSARPATVKAMLPEEVAATGARDHPRQHLSPDAAARRRARRRAGRAAQIHELAAGRSSPIRGGFQVMSLAKLRKIGESGVTFRSHLDGSAHRADAGARRSRSSICSAPTSPWRFDECTPFPADARTAARSSMELSMRWAERSQAGVRDAAGPRALRHRPGRRLSRSAPALGRGAARHRLRRLCGRRARRRRGAGDDVRACSTTTVPALPEDRPRYLMGVGKPDDLVGAVARGIDMFDCVLPTRSGRTGAGLHPRAARSICAMPATPTIRAPLDADCACPACRGYSAAPISIISCAPARSSAPCC